MYLMYRVFFALSSINYKYRKLKKRHEQKLVILSLLLFFIFNVPFLYSYNIEREIAGIPVFYFVIFLFWAVSIVVSYIILKKYYE